MLGLCNPHISMSETLESEGFLLFQGSFKELQSLTKPGSILFPQVGVKIKHILKPPPSYGNIDQCFDQTFHHFSWPPYFT